MVAGPSLLCGRADLLALEFGLVLATACEQRPDDARVLVRECDGGDVDVASLQELLQPGIAALIRFAPERPQHGSRSVDQQSPQVGVTALADPEQGGLAAAV